MKPRTRVVAVVLSLIVIGAAAVALIAWLSRDEPVAVERPVGDARHADSILAAAGPRPRVEVLNAAGVPGLARQATEQLRDRGVDVVFFGNASDFDQDSTVVIARTADPAAARRVARALGVDSLVVEPDPALYLDATVRLGRNWPPAAQEPEPGMADRLRRLVP